MKFRKLLPAAILIISAASCGTSHKTTRTPVELTPLRVSANNNPAQIFRGSAPRVWDIIHTEASLDFDPDAKTAHVSESLFIKPHVRDTNLIVLDAKGLQIERVELTSYYLDKGTGGAGAFHAGRMALPYKYNGKELSISLPKNWQDSSTSPIHRPHLGELELHFEYTAMPYADSTVGGSSAISEDRGLYFINTDGRNKQKPQQIWTQGETESNSHWLITIDKPNQRTSVKLTLMVPDTIQTLSNGYKNSSIAAPARPGYRQDTWVMTEPIQPYAIMFAIGRFAVTADEHPGGVPVAYYVEPQYADAAKAIFHKTPQMIDFFSKITGVPYPWNKYSQVVVRDYVSGAMENTSASLFGEFMNGTKREIADKPDNEDVVSHELFHQWFGDYVTAESWSNLTLNESFATYGEVLWRRFSQGRASADELANSDLVRYLESTEAKDPPLVRYYYRDREDMFDRISYQKGGAILRYMNGLMGDEEFSRAMKLYLTKNALQPAEASDWRKAVEEATGADWTQFFNEWYLRGGHPLINVRYDYNDTAHQLIVTTRQQSSPDSSLLYNLVLKAAVLDEGKLRVIDWNISRRSNRDTINYTGSARPVFMPDYYRWLPGFIFEEGKTVAQYRQQLQASDNYGSKRRAVGNAIMLNGADHSEELLALTKNALTDTIPGIRYLALTTLGNATEAWEDALRTQVEYLAVQDPERRIRAEAFTLLGLWKKVPGAEDLAKVAVNDESYLIAGAALRALIRMQPDTAYALAKALLAQDTRANAESAALEAIAQKGRPEDFILFKARAAGASGTKQIALANNIYSYSMNTKDDATYERSLALLAEMSRAENIKGYRSAIGAMVFSADRFYRTAKKKEDKEAGLRRLPVIARYEEEIMSGEKDETVREEYRILKAKARQ